MLKSSFLINEIPDCSIVTLPEDLTYNRGDNDCSKFTLSLDNDHNIFGYKFSAS